MKHSIVALLLLCFRLLPLAGQNFTSSNLPILLINTNGAQIVDEPKTAATMQIIDNGIGQINHLTDPANGFDGDIGIELRGSSSQFYEKKPYSIEIRDETGEEKDFPLLGMPEEHDWVLVQPLNDKTLMRDVLAYKFASQVMPWAPRTRYTEVFINGQYEGVYILAEKIKRDKNRVDISKLKSTDIAGDSLTGGYLLKMDKLNQGPGGDWASPYPPFQGSFAATYFQIDYPNAEDIMPEQRAYIQNYVTDFENALYTWTPNSPNPVYEEWIDTDSWINYFFINEVSKNVDGYRLSSYFYKDRDDEEGKIKMGPVWDYNISFGIGDYCDGQSHTGWAKDFNLVCPNDAWVIHFWWDKLCKDTFFQQKVSARWQELRSTTWTDDKMTQCVDSIAGLLSEAQTRNFQRWPVLGQYVWPNAYIGATYNQEVDYLRNWISQRLHWMDNNIGGIGSSTVLAPYNYIADALVFPNPITQKNSLSFRYSTQGLDGATFLLYDAEGKLLSAPYDLPKGGRVEHTIELPLLSNGIYFYQIKIDDKIIKTGSIEVSR